MENVGRYQIIDARSEKAKVDKLVKDLCKSVDESSKNHPPLEEAEKTVETIISLFDGSIGSEPTSEQMKDWLAEAQERYSNKIPPGYKDDKKEVGDRYSDYIIWRELLGIAKQRNLPVLFLTDDRKEDWVATRNGQYLGPRPELLQEFRAETDQRYYSYQLTAFLERAKEYMKVEVSKDTIKDVATGTAKQVEQTAKPNKADDKKDLPTEVIAPIDTSQSNLGKPTTIEFEGSSKPNEVDPKENNS